MGKASSQDNEQNNEDDELDKTEEWHWCGENVYKIQQHHKLAYL